MTKLSILAQYGGENGAAMKKPGPSPVFATIATVPLAFVSLFSGAAMVHTYCENWPLLVVWLGIGLWVIVFLWRRAGGSDAIRIAGGIGAAFSVAVSAAWIGFYVSLCLGG